MSCQITEKDDSVEVICRGDSVEYIFQKITETKLSPDMIHDLNEVEYTQFNSVKMVPPSVQKTIRNKGYTIV